MRKIFYFAMLLAMPAVAQQTTVSTFEDADVTFNEKGYWNGGKTGEPEQGDWGENNYYCKATSGRVTANITYSEMEYAYWWRGVALSKSTGSEFKVLDDQYNNIVGTGANGSATFAVVYGDNSTIDINAEGGAMVNYLYVTNSAYTHNNFTVNTGSYDTKFTADGDHIYLNIEATKADGTTKTAVVKLAEYVVDTLLYINTWQRIDLDTLGNDVLKLTFSFDCNKPMVATYACIDNIAVVTGIGGAATFENLTLEKDSYWNGTDDTGSFVSGAFKFENGHQAYDYGTFIYDYCYGFFYTNSTATTYTGNPAVEQYNSIVGKGAEQSATFATYNVNAYDEKKVTVLGEAREVSGFYVTNAAYSYTSMLNGDDYAKKFGADDWFKLTVTGYDAKGEQTGTVDFYLADLRDSEKAYIINTWRWVDLTPLGKVKSLGFSMSSTDTGDWGMNTPAYFCMDNLGGVKPEQEDPIETFPLGISTVTANTLTQQYFDLNGRRMAKSQKGLTIVRMADGTVRKIMVK